MGILTEQGPQPWHPASPEVREAGRKVAQFCSNHGLDIADVAMRFSLDHPHVRSTLIGLGTTQQVEACLNVLENFTDVELLRQLQEMIAPAFNYAWPSGRPENQD
jgi:L-galactose dehydrogenase